MGEGVVGNFDTFTLSNAASTGTPVAESSCKGRYSLRVTIRRRVSKTDPSFSPNKSCRQQENRCAPSNRGVGSQIRRITQCASPLPEFSTS